MVTKSIDLFLSDGGRVFTILWLKTTKENHDFIWIKCPRKRLDANLTALTPEQAAYIGVPAERLYKAEHYRN